MLNRFDINLSGGSRNFFQDISIFSNESEDVADGDRLTSEDSNSREISMEAIGSELEDEEFNDCIDEEEYRQDNDIEREEEEEDSSEDGGQVVLAYDRSQLSDIDGPPQNGHDYLRLVERETKELPSVFSCRKSDKQRKLSESDDKQSTSSTLSADSHTSIEYVPMNSENIYHISAKPSNSSQAEKMKSDINDDFDDLRFREDILNNFKRLREKIDAIRETKTVQSLQERERISEKQMKKTIDRSNRQANSLIRLMELGHPPQVSTLITKSQLELHLTLEKLADQCDIAPNCSRTIHTDWIYSLIAALREPIEPDICSTLRRITRICLAKRKLYEDKAKSQSSKSEVCGGISTSGCSSASKNSRSINQPTPKSQQAATKAQQNSSSRSSKASKTRQAGRTPENNEELVEELEEEEYTSCLLIICIVRYYFGQVDLK